jgi:acetoacetate decarboxylase
MRERLDFVTNFNLKIIPSITGDDAIRQITARDFADLVIHECWEGPVTVELRPNAQAPVYRLPVVEMLTGFLWRCDFTLDYGEVVHDYLAPNAQAD